VLRIDEVPDPDAGPGQVLVAVHAASVNPVDCKIRAGTQRVAVHWTLPHGTGLDVAGRVVAIGEGVKGFSVGDAVYGSPDHHHAGTCAEFVAVDAAQLALAPKGISWVEAASLPLVALTVWDAFVRVGQVEPGQRVLILGGGGGVGTAAIQIAKARGAIVSATCSAPNV
jgi:NADPH:quinone reductase-like Zn-dependent oxidoreductase